MIPTTNQPEPTSSRPNDLFHPAVGNAPKPSN